MPSPKNTGFDFYGDYEELDLSRDILDEDPNLNYDDGGFDFYGDELDEKLELSPDKEEEDLVRFIDDESLSPPVEPEPIEDKSLAIPDGTVGAIEQSQVPVDTYAAPQAPSMAPEEPSPDAPMQTLASGISLPDEDLVGPSDGAQTSFFVSGDRQIPTELEYLSADQTRNQILNALARQDLTSDVKEDLRIQYARLLSGEGYSPERSRPQNERLANRLEDLAKQTSEAQGGLVTKKRTNVRLPQDRSGKESIYDTVKGETSTQMLGQSFSTPFTPDARQYINTLANEELRTLPVAERSAILRNLKPFSFFETMNHEDILYDTGQATGIVTKLLGGASNVVSGAAVIPYAVVAAAVAGRSTLDGEAISSQVNQGAIRKAYESFGKYKNNKSPTTAVDDVVFNVVDGKGNAQTNLNRLPEISLRGARVGRQFPMPKYFSSDVARIIGKFDDEDFIKKARVLVGEALGIKDEYEPGTYRLNYEITNYLEKAKSLVFTKGRSEDDTEYTRYNKMDEVVDSLEALMEKESRANQVSSDVENAYTYYTVLAQTDQSYVKPFLREKLEDKNSPEKKAWLKISGGVKDPREIPPEIWEEMLHGYISKEEQNAMVTAASEGLLGEEWKGTGLSKEKANLRHHVAAHLTMLYKQTNTPEFNTVLQEYGSNFAKAIADTPEEMLISLAALPGLSNFFSEEQIERSYEKWKNEPVYAALDTAFFSNLIGRLGKFGTMTTVSMTRAFKGVKNGDYSNLRQAINAEQKALKREVEEVKVKSTEEKYAELTTEEMPVERDIPATVIYASDETSTIVYSQKKAATLREEAAATTDPALKQSLEKSAKAYDDNAKTAELYYTEGLPSSDGPGSPKQMFVQEDPGPTTRHKQSRAGQRVSTFNDEGKIRDFEKTETTTINMRNDLYANDLIAHVDDVLFANDFISKFAKSRNIKDPFVNPRGFARLLIKEGVSDSRIYEYLINNSKIKGIDKSPKAIAKTAAMGKKVAYERGLESRTKTMSEIVEDGPVSILSKETRESPEFVRSRLDSLKIAEELREAGETNPFAYSGLSLTDKEISEFVRLGGGVKNKKPSVQSKIQEQEYLLNSEGTYIGEKIVESRGGPRVIRGFENNLKPGAPLVRVVGKWLTGDNAYAMGAAARGSAGNKLFYSSLAVFEYMHNPFAVIHLPKLYRETASEAMNWFYSNGRQSKMVESFLTALVKPSREIGDLYRIFTRLKTESNLSKSEIIQFINDLPPELADVVITKAHVDKHFGEAAAKGFSETKVAPENFSTIQVNIHKGMDIDIDISIPAKPNKKKGSSTGSEVETVKPSDILELEIDATIKILSENKKLVEKLEDLLNLKLKDGKRSEDGFSFKETNKGKRVIAELEREIYLNEKRLENGNVYESVDTVYSRNDFMTNKEQLARVGELRFKLKKPIDQMTQAEKTVAVIAQEYILPAKQKVFNKVAQLITGEGNQKLTLASSTAPKGIVLKKTTHKDFSTTYDVVKKFEDTIEGNASASSWMDNLGKKEGKKTRAETVVEEATGPGSEYILSNQDELSAYLLYGDDLFEGVAKKPSVSFSTEALIPRLSNYLSVYIDSEALSNMIIKTLDDIKSGKSTPGEMTIASEHLQRQLLFGTPEGAELFKANGRNMKKTWEKLLAMTEADQSALLGRALTTQEKFFNTQAFGSSFEPKQLLDTYTGYQYALSKTLQGLDQNITMLKMQDMLRNRGQILTKAEHAALKRSGSPLANSFIEPGNLKPRILRTVEDGAPIFGKSLDGFVLAKPAANYLAKQAGLSIVQSSMSNRLFQAFKFAKILDPIGGAIFRNVISSIVFHGYGAGPIPVNYKYVKRFREDYKRFKRGEAVKDPRVEQIIREGIGTGSRRAEFESSALMEGFEDLIIDIMDSAGDTKTLVDSIQGTNSIKEINKLVDVLSLKGYEKKANAFLNSFKVEADPSSARVSAKIKKRDATGIKARTLRGIEKGIGFGKSKLFDPVLDAYSIFDEYGKGGYTLQLMDQQKMPRSRAFGIASDTYVDYLDMSSIFNSLRYGARGGVGYGLFGMPFVGYSANGFYLAKTMLSKNTVRSWIASHMMRSQDDALEQTLKLGFTMEQYRDIVQKPTLQLLPLQQTGKAVKDPYGKTLPIESREAGIASVRGETISPLSFISLSKISQQFPAQDKNPEMWDLLPAVYKSIGGPLSEIIKAVGDDEKSSQRNKIRDQVELMLDKMKANPEKYPQSDIDKIEKVSRFNETKGSSSYIENVGAAILDIATPTIYSNIQRAIRVATGEPLAGKRAYPSEAAKFFGLNVVPSSMRTVLTQHIVDKESASEMSSAIAALKTLNGGLENVSQETREFILSSMGENIKLVEKLKNEMKAMKDPIAKQALKELELIEMGLVGSWLDGDLSENELKRLLIE